MSTLRNPMECSLPGSSIHGIFQARVLDWGAIAFSEGWGILLPIELKSVSSRPRRMHSLCSHRVGAGRTVRNWCPAREPGARAIAILGIFVTLRFTKLQGLSEVTGDVPSCQSTSKGVRAQWEKIRFRSSQNLSPNAIPEIHEV